MRGRIREVSGRWERAPRWAGGVRPCGAVAPHAGLECAPGWQSKRADAINQSARTPAAIALSGPSDSPFRNAARIANDIVVCDHMLRGSKRRGSLARASDASSLVPLRIRYACTYVKPAPGSLCGWRGSHPPADPSPAPPQPPGTRCSQPSAPDAVHTQIIGMQLHSPRTQCHQLMQEYRASRPGGSPGKPRDPSQRTRRRVATSSTNAWQDCEGDYYRPRFA